MTSSTRSVRNCFKDWHCDDTKRKSGLQNLTSHCTDQVCCISLLPINWKPIKHFCFPLSCCRHMINNNSFTYCYLPSNSYLVNRDLLVLTDTVHWMRGTPRQSRGPQRTWSSTLGPPGVNDFVPQLPTGASHFSALDIGGQPKGLLQAQIHENFNSLMA